MEETRFTIDPERVIAEQFEGETVVVNLDTGAYFSLRGTALLVWSWLTAGAGTGEIARRLDPREDRLADVTGFIALLQKDELISASAEAALPLPPEASGPAIYAAPTFEKYTDMAELLLLDPIHDVAPMGWPAARTEADSSIPAV